MSLICLHSTGSPTITGTMWLGFGEMRHAGLVEPAAQPRDAVLVPLALGRAGLQMPDAGERAGGDRRRQRRW